MISIQQAATNTFAAWLTTKMAGVVVSSNWPSPDRELPNKAITVITAGARRDRAMDLSIIKQVNNGTTNVDATWLTTACVQPLQLDIWAHSNFERDDILAKLDTYLHWGEREINANSDPVGPSVLLALGDGWEAFETIADFAFADPDTDDTSDSVGRDVFRATFRGTADFNLAITRTSSRQKHINFSMFLDGDSAATTYSVP